MMVDLIVENGRIHTGDPEAAVVDAVAVLNGRVVAAGNDVEGLRARERVDAHDRVVLPGFNDAHAHSVWFGMTLIELRSALVRPGRGRLAGTVEVDETFIGGEEHGLRGGRQPGKKVLTGIAVEIGEPKGIGRCRMAVLADASGASLGPFVASSVEPGSRVITDGWVGYNGLAALGYAHERRNQKAAARRGQDPGELLPAVHRISSLCKRWLLGTHQGRVEPAHLQAYLNEFAFRFNRRHSRSRGMVFYRVLELAAGHDPVRYDDIRATRKPRSKPPQQRGTGHPPSLDRPAAARPWRD